MSKKRKSVKKTAPKKYDTQQALTIYLEKLDRVLTKIGLENTLDELTSFEKLVVFAKRFNITDFKILNPNVVTSKTVKELSKVYKKTIHSVFASYKTLKEPITTFEAMMLFSFDSILRCPDITKERQEELKTIFEFTSELTPKSLFNPFINSLYIFTTYYSCFNKVHLGYTMNFTNKLNNPRNPHIDITLGLSSLKAQSTKVVIDNIYRTVHRIAQPRPSINEGIRWTSIPSCYLEKIYSGKKQVLDLYIQQHAINRIIERISLTDERDYRIVLFFATSDIDVNGFVYNNNFLMPVSINNIKVGYLVSSVINDKLIIKTCLLVTHRNTPEGDKLAEISGLSWGDISFWQIDKLSSMFSLDRNKHKLITDIFAQAGIELDKLKEEDLMYHFKRTSSTSLMNLSKYITKGQENIEIVNDDVFAENDSLSDSQNEVQEEEEVLTD